MATTHIPPELDSRQRLAASIHRVLRHEIPERATEDELRTSIDTALEEEAQRNELTIAYLRAGVAVGIVLAYVVGSALATTAPHAASAVVRLLQLVGVVLVGATAAAVVALRHGWYRPWVRRAMATEDAIAIVVASLLLGEIAGPTSIAGPVAAASLGTLLALSGALRLTRSAVHFATALALAAVLAGALLSGFPAAAIVMLVTAVLVGGASSMVILRLVRRALTNQVGRATMDRLYGEAQQVIEARAEVLRVVAHDLRNPLNTIIMGASSLLETPVPESQVRQLRIVRRAAERMNRLIQDLLSVSIIEAGRLTVELARVDLRALVAEVLETLGPLANEKSIQLDASLPAELPPVRADAARILQVFSNLIGNAIKFTPSQGRISLSATAIDGAVRCDVIDTGPGIPPEQLPKIFGRFWQSKRGDRRGIGLGLSIARGIIEAHGQRLWVTSKVGEGSIFSFTLERAG